MTRATLMRAGFTLIELMVAITICVGMLAWASGMVDAVAASSSRVRRLASAESLSTERASSLRELMLNVEAGDSSLFVGDAQGARFTSWCDAGFHVRARCLVLAHVDTALTVTTLGKTRTLWHDTTGAELRYLSDAHSGGAWLTSWGEQPIAPLGLAIITVRDTIVFRIGVRQ